MTTNVDDAKQGIQDEKDMQAAFNEATSSQDTEEIAQPSAESNTTETEGAAEVEKPTEKPAEATPTAPPISISEEQLKLLAAIPELEKRLMQQVDTVSGRYGEIKRLLEETKKAAATPKSAAEFEASVDGDSLDQEFPELSQGIQEKIDRALAKVQAVPAGMSEQQLQEWYEKRKAEDYKASVVILDTAHPDRIEIKESAEYKEWLAGMPAYKQQAFLNSQDPYYVSSKLSEFKEYRDKKSSAAEKSKQRIENAITPQGVKPKGPSTVSDDEAAQAAFEAQFS
jgi:anion-transporting  ArsA/GET3 family ATPase